MPRLALLEEFRLGAQMLRRGATGTVTGGPTRSGRPVCRIPGPQLVRSLFLRDGELFADISPEGGGPLRTVRLAGPARPSKLLSSLTDAPYSLTLN
jgi:hypothetical protein